MKASPKLPVMRCKILSVLGVCGTLHGNVDRAGRGIKGEGSCRFYATLGFNLALPLRQFFHQLQLDLLNLEQRKPSLLMQDERDFSCQKAETRLAFLAPLF